MKKKIEAQWIDGSTPPNGYVLDDNGRAVMNQGLVSVFRAQIVAMNANGNDDHINVVSLPPTSTNHNPVPPMVLVSTQASSAGNSFGR